MNDPLKGVAHAGSLYSIPEDVMSKALELVKLVNQQDEYGVTIVFNRGMRPLNAAPLLSGGLPLSEQLPFLLIALTALSTELQQDPDPFNAGETPVCNCPRCQERRRLEQAEKVVH